MVSVFEQEHTRNPLLHDGHTVVVVLGVEVEVVDVVPHREMSKH